MHGLHGWCLVKANVLPHLASHFILGRLAQKFDVSDLAISVERVHEDAQASAWLSFLVIEIGEDPIFGLCLHVQQHWLLLLARDQKLFENIANTGSTYATCIALTGQAYCVCHKAERHAAGSVCCHTQHFMLVVILLEESLQISVSE